MADREYFPCYHSYFKKCEKLTDQELGRLFRALMMYSSTGERQELAGRESIAFDFIADDIDRADGAYREKCEKNSKNGKRGGRPKNQTVSEKPNGFKKSQDKDKDKDKDNTPPPDGGGSKRARGALYPPKPEDYGFGPELSAAFSDWIKYKREKRQEYKPTGLTALVSQVRNNAAKYGEDAIAALIRQCMAANWQGIIWGKLDKPPDTPRGGKPGKYTAQDFQPTADRIQKNNDWLDEFLYRQQKEGSP